MILNALLKKRVDAIAQMGMLECESFRNEDPFISGFEVEA